MQKEDFKLFPTLVTRYRNILSSEQSDIIFNHCNNLPHQQHHGWVGNGTSSHHIQKNLLDDLELNLKECLGIKSELEFYINIFSKNFGYHKDLCIFNSWFNIQQPNSVLKMHTHPQSIFSAVLFVKCDSESSCLVFQNPNAELSYLNTALEGYVDYQSGISAYQNISFKPSIGDLIIFPSWLKHGSGEDINQGKDRMSISFNCRFIQ